MHHPVLARFAWERQRHILVMFAEKRVLLLPFLLLLVHLEPFSL